MEESDTFETRDAAIKRASIALENARDMDLPEYTVHVIDRETGEFIATHEFGH